MIGEQVHEVKAMAISPFYHESFMGARRDCPTYHVISRGTEFLSHYNNEVPTHEITNYGANLGR